MEREYYAIAKVQTPDIAAPNEKVPHDAELLFFKGGIQAIQYMKQQLDAPQKFSMSWKDPKDPSKKIGLTQSYIVFKTTIRSPLQVDDSTRQIPGCIGHAQREWRATVHAAMIGRDSAGPTTYLLYNPKHEFAVTPQEELDNRIEACKIKYLKQKAEANLANSPLPDIFPDELPSEKKNGPELIREFYDQLTERGLDGYAMQMYHAYFDDAFITMKSYDDDGRSAAYDVIRDIFSEIARADITKEISNWAVHVVKQVETQSHPDGAWGDDDPGDPYGSDRLSVGDASRLLGYEIELPY